MNERLAELESQVKKAYEKYEELKEWEPYHEPLSRIFREIKKALPDWRKNKSLTDDGLIKTLIEWDGEVRPEIENLLQKMITEIENGMD